MDDVGSLLSSWPAGYQERHPLPRNTDPRSAAPPSAAQIDDAGAIEAAKQRRQEEIRARLAAGTSVVESAEVEKQVRAGAWALPVLAFERSKEVVGFEGLLTFSRIERMGAVAMQLEGQLRWRASAAQGAERKFWRADAAAAVQVAADYYTQEEMAKFQKPRKKKERKLKKKGITAEELAALEAEAASAAGGAAGSDLGSRAAREQRAVDKAAAALAAAAERTARFDAALSKANYASLALRNDDAAAAASEEAPAEDDDLYASLNK